MWGKFIKRSKPKVLEISLLGTEWRLLRLRRARLPIWSYPLIILVIPLILLLVLTLFLLFVIMGITIYLAFLKPFPRSKRISEERTIEAEYWVERGKNKD
jgi:hypothetical protein